MERAVKVLERMENQNTYKEIAMDFKVSYDHADPRDQKGLLATVPITAYAWHEDAQQQACASRCAEFDINKRRVGQPHDQVASTAS